MKAIHVVVAAALVAAGMPGTGAAAGGPEEMARSAFRQILAEADRNKDGKLSVAECKAMFKDPAVADRNCGFWDANRDGTITEDEYVAQAKSVQRRR